MGSLHARGLALAVGICITGACSSGGMGSNVSIGTVTLPASGAGNLPVRFTLIDPEGDAADVRIEVSRDGGASWRAARLSTSSVTTALATSADGVEHTVTWDSLADLGFRPLSGAQIRVVPSVSGATGTGSAAAVPTLDNLPRAIAAVDTYMIHYGVYDAATIALAETHDLVIVHPGTADLPAATVRAIQDGVDPDDPADDVLVLAYISVGEDSRTVGVTDAEMLLDPRFVGDGSGPRVDPRGPNADGQPLTGIDPLGIASNGGTGYASWYLDDNSIDRDAGDVGDGKPDRNAYFGGCFVNAGDPQWLDVLDQMRADTDGSPGIRELLTTTFGRGYGCDGLFLDTIDTCAPNSYTDASSGNQSEFEWTAPGFADFIRRLRERYPQTIILQNRGVFFFDPRHPQYAASPRSWIDFLKYESYRLDSSTAQEFDPFFFPDNKFNIAPKMMAEAQRPDGFKVLSLGYAEGPPGSIDHATLLGTSDVGRASLLEDIREAEDLAGFRHYITDALVALPNAFVRDNRTTEDTTAPVWTSVYNANIPPFPNPPTAPDARVGLGEVVTGGGYVTVRWDVALDRGAVGYALYRSTQPFDFVNDPTLSNATRVVLTPDVGDGYVASFGASTYPFQATVTGLDTGVRYWLCLRAFDDSGNEDRNEVTASVTPLGQRTITIDGLLNDWVGVPAALLDPADVADSAGPDWQQIKIVNDAQDLFVCFTSENTFNLDGSPDFGFSRTLIFIDADDDPATGYAISGIGSDLLVNGDNLYAQSAGNFNAGLLQAIAFMPQVGVTQAELAIPRSRIDAAAPGTTRVRLLFLNDQVSDAAPDSGGLLFLFQQP